MPALKTNLILHWQADGIPGSGWCAWLGSRVFSWIWGYRLVGSPLLWGMRSAVAIRGRGMKNEVPVQVSVWRPKICRDNEK